MLRSLLLLTSLLSVSSYTYRFPPHAHAPLLSIALQASFSLNSTRLHLQPGPLQGLLSDGNLSVSLPLDPAAPCNFSLHFSRPASSWQLSTAVFSCSLNGSEVREELDQLLLRMGDGLPLSLLRNHSYLCETPFSHSSALSAVTVEVSYFQFEFDPPHSGFNEPQVCLIAYDQFWIQATVGLSLILFLTIVVVINGIYHNGVKLRKKLLRSNTYSMVPIDNRPHSEHDDK